MNDRSRAIDILKEAREILARRMTERIVDNGEELLEDASGESFMGEIESLHEQLGLRLAHVAQMISALPVIRDEPRGGDANELDAPLAEAAIDIENVSADSDGPHPAVSSHVVLSPPGLPAPVSETVGAASTEQISFQTFVAQILQNQLEGAGYSLSILFDVEYARGLACAKVFHIQHTADPQFMNKAKQLRTELVVGSFNSAMVLLYKCFGLTGLEAVTVAQTLKARFAVGGQSSGA